MPKALELNENRGRSLCWLSCRSKILKPSYVLPIKGVFYMLPTSLAGILLFHFECLIYQNILQIFA